MADPHVASEQLTETSATPSSPWGSFSQLGPGLLLAALAAVVAMVLARALAAAGVPAVNPLLIGIVLGVVAANLRRLRPAPGPGLAVAGRRWLRVGIVLLGLQISLGELADLGLPVVGLAVGVVVVGMTTAWVVGGLLGVSVPQRLLIGAGFSICGAAAIAAVERSVPRRSEQDLVSALALVVVFGTLAIPAVAMIAPALGLTPAQAGTWAGGSIHEVAQVVAAAGILGPDVLQVAVPVKLTRVLVLAPVVVVVGVLARADARGATAAGGGAAPTARTPLVPLFVTAFLAVVLARSFVPMPGPLLAVGNGLATFFLAAAMFALGSGVDVRSLRQVPVRTLVLALVVTLVVAGVALAGALAWA